MKLHSYSMISMNENPYLQHAYTLGLSRTASVWAKKGKLDGERVAKLRNKSSSTQLNSTQLTAVGPLHQTSARKTIKSKDNALQQSAHSFKHVSSKTTHRFYDVFQQTWWTTILVYSPAVWDGHLQPCQVAASLPET